MRKLVSNRARKLVIYSWGRNVHAEPAACELTFDLTGFCSEYNRRDIREEDGRSEAVQRGMRSHAGFAALMSTVIQAIERANPQAVSFVCSWGKHRSMAWAEILKADYYPRARVKSPAPEA